MDEIVSVCRSHGAVIVEDAAEALGAEHRGGRPIWKPMHMQPIYRMDPFVTRDGNGCARNSAYIDDGAIADVGTDIFARGACLPGDNKMMPEQQAQVSETVKACFA